MLSPLTPYVVALLAALWLLAWNRLPAAPARLSPLLAHRAAPFAAAALSSLAVWWVWGSLRAVPAVHDETAYLLQSRIFAAGRWTAPAPPLPEFFEQFHVLVTPAVAAKYPPGHALAMAPGALLGLPGLVPVLLAGVAGGLLFALTRRLAGVWAALLAWVLWIGAPANLRWRASYFSESTSSAACLAALACFLRWRETGRPGWLLAVAAAVGWGAITRPLTLLAFALPLGVAVLAETRRRRAWPSLAGAAAVGVLVLGVVPLWSAHTTGDWRVTPLARYTREYIPWDHMGLGLDRTRPERTLPPDMVRLSAAFEEAHRRYVAAALPRAAGERAWQVLWGVTRWQGARLPGVPTEAALRLLLAGCLAAGALSRVPGARFTAATTLLMFGAYLAYMHPPFWTLYYVEIFPAIAFLCAVGFLRLANALARALRRPDPRGWANRAALLSVGLLVPAAVINTAYEQRAAWGRQAYTRDFERMADAAPGDRVVVFVRYRPDHPLQFSLVRNTPDPAAARVWVAYDRGADDLRLLRAAPGRVPYLYDEASGRLYRMWP